MLNIPTIATLFSGGEGVGAGARAAGLHALARFQSFPDWYKLPEKRKTACAIVGNAVPPLLYEKLIRQLMENRR